MQQHFRESVDTFVEFVVCHRRIFEAEFVGDDEGWLCAAADDQVAEVSVVRFHVALAGTWGKKSARVGMQEWMA